MSKIAAAAGMTFIGAGTTITGEISVEHDLRVEGHLKGTVTAGGMLIVGPTGKIEGEVTARSVTLAGQVIGNVKGDEKVVLETKSALFGDLQTRELIINEGAVFQGNCNMRSDEGK